MNAQAQSVKPKRELWGAAQLVAAGLISIAVVLALVFLLRGPMSGGSDSAHPSDADLETLFRGHEEKFTRLVEMSRADKKVMRIASDFTWLEDNVAWPRPKAQWGLSAERWDEYRRLFKELGLKGGVLQDTKGGITYLIASSSGLVTNGTMKGYAYSTEELSPTADSLDDIASLRHGRGAIFKKLSGRWYLFYWNL